MDAVDRGIKLSTSMVQEYIESILVIGELYWQFPAATQGRQIEYSTNHLHLGWLARGRLRRASASMTPLFTFEMK